MLNDFLLLLIGLVLLWTPRAWLRLGKPRKNRRALKQTGGPNRDRHPGDHTLWVEEEFKRMRNWLDLGRALTGALAVQQSVPGVVNALVGVPDASLDNIIYLSQAVLLLAGVLIQMLRIEERLSFYPPIFFVLGLGLAIGGLKAGVIGFIIIWAINVVLPNPAVFLAVYGGGMVVLCVFFDRGLKAGLMIGALALMAPLLATLFRRRLVQFRKRTKIVSR